MREVELTYSVADQEFDRTKSLGVLRVSLELARRLALCREVRRLHVLGNSSVEGQVGAGAGVAFTTHDGAMRSRAGRILWDQVGLYAAAHQVGNRLLLLPKGFAPFVRTPPVRLVTYVHDTLLHYYERHYPSGFSLFERNYFLAGFRASLRHSALILTNSEFTTSEIRAVAACWGQPLPPIVTAGIGVVSAVSPVMAKHERVVVLASPLPHKRTDLALAYVARWARQSGFRGDVDWIGQLPRGLVFPDMPGWRLYPRLRDGNYERLLRRAKVLVYVSEYEGFGMPPVEAAALGAAPVYSSIPATREVMAGAGFAFDNRSFDSFAAAMTAAMAVSPATVLAAAAPLLARHDWDAVVGRVTRALADVA